MASNDNHYIRFDWAMKHMLRDKANFEILEGFLSVLLNDNVKIVEILEGESNADSADDKFNRVDIKAKNHKGHIVIIEVQLTSQLHFLERILYGTSKTITEHITLGDKYDKVKKVYSINILYCNFGNGDDYIYHGTTHFKGLHTGNELSLTTKEDGVIVQKFPENIFPEYYLVRVNAFDKVPETPLEEWMDYLKLGKIKENTRTPGLQKVKEKLRYLNMTKEERRAYERHVDNMVFQNDVFEAAHIEGLEKGREEGIELGRAEGREEGIELGRELGREEGVQEGVRKMVRCMIEGGIPPEKLVEMTGLTLEEVSKLMK